MKFKLEIECDNAAFGDVHDDGRHDSEALFGELARILLKCAADLVNLQYLDRNVYDANGNLVGHYRIYGRGVAHVHAKPKGKRDDQSN